MDTPNTCPVRGTRSAPTDNAYWPSLEKFYGRPDLPPLLQGHTVNVMQVAAAPFLTELVALRRKKKKKASEPDLVASLEQQVEAAPPTVEPEPPLTSPSTTVPTRSKTQRKAQRLRKRLERALANFEYLTLSSGQTAKDVRVAHYMLCALADELAMSSKLDAEQHWSSHTLSSKWHNEAQAGEGFFVYLERLLKMPANHLELLELAYICLALGFQGELATLPDGHTRLESLRDNLFKRIQTLRGQPDPQLSPRWQPMEVQRQPVVRITPTWLVITATLLTLGVLYGGFSTVLAIKREQVLELYRAKE